MGTEVISDGIDLTVPTSGTQNWASTVKQGAWRPISSHTHTGSGDGLKLSGSALNDGGITLAKMFPNQGRTQAAALTPAGASPSQNIDWDLGSKQTLDITGATGVVTVTFVNQLAGGDYRIVVLVGATVATITWPAAVQWPGGVEPSQHFNASTTNVVTLDYDGTTFYGNYQTEWS